MKELNYRFKSIEEKIINGKEVHKVKDIFNDNEAFVEKYKEIKDMDWEGTSKIEDELNKLKDNKTITDFFYNNDYDRDLKIFYKVFEHYDKYETHNVAVSSRTDPEMEATNSQTHENPTKQTDILETEKPLEQEKPAHTVHKLSELGGSVKVEIKPKNDLQPTTLKMEKEDIFTSNLLDTQPKTFDNINSNLELNYKKTVSRAEMNNKIICKVCEQPLKKERLNIEKNIGYCENCHTIRQIKTLNQEEKARKKISIIAPNGIIVKNTGSKLHIETQLNVKSGFISIFIAIIMSLFALSYGSSNNPTALIFTLFAIAIAYTGLIDIINKVYINVTKQSIIIKSKPLPHFPMKIFISDKISQIYVKEYIHKNKNSTTYSYKVRAILKNGKDKVLVKLDNPEYALYLERSIESWLRIEDRYVSGEYK